MNTIDKTYRNYIPQNEPIVTCYSYYEVAFNLPLVMIQYQFVKYMCRMILFVFNTGLFNG